MVVTLGEKKPSWGINRWNGNSGLRFVPPDDEGFTMRGDRQRLVYKGRRRSHRFTILGDTAFEYDCILEKEPDSNVITLLMEGAESFDFFRQPDFVKDPFLKGSYAVYKKETLVGEGTGKLCHIHRPLIIDARGRRCWGELSIVGDELRITIPEQWLSEAAYPVTVDPTVGTTTIGTQQEWPDDNFGDFVEFGWDIAVNRFLAPETINGACMAYAYTYESDYNEGGHGVMYSDNSNKPLTKRSRNEEWFTLYGFGRNEGWGRGPFELNSAIPGGTYIWFGIHADEIWWPLFDYGSRCYFSHNNTVYYPPNTFPTPNYYLDMKLSMYFTYTNGQNFTRTIYQWAGMTDKRKLKADYKRKTTQTTKVNSTLSRLEIFYRNCTMTVHNTMNMSRIPSFLRKLAVQINSTTTNTENRSLSRKCTDGVKANVDEKRMHSSFRKFKEDITVNSTLSRFETMYRHCVIVVYNTMNLNRLQTLYRNAIEHIKVTSTKWGTLSVFRKCAENVYAGSEMKRTLSNFRKIIDSFKGHDTQSLSVLFVRSLSDSTIVNHHSRHFGSFIRGLLATAGSDTETSHKADYYRYQKDRVQVQGPVLRNLFLFVRIITKVFFRDYLLGRFLRARQELVLKSIICREIILESKLN
jgi:hypothetical protein